MIKLAFIILLLFPFLNTQLYNNKCNVSECNGCCIDNTCIPETQCKYLFYGSIAVIFGLLALSILIIFIFTFVCFCKLFLKKKQNKYLKMNEECKEISVEINFDQASNIQNESKLS